ncbi:ABC transporter ATP-binding protein [Pleionea sp. CnH1-48]|uniref:ABC transporter ATP-binding protein n=1 Tax=Pleionea sp. CnH1-48 TaxID=2954494 RepID=UPI002098059A|nr:ATP-binding cassette domain-containing protein [Pleionea sp. CnH1-48]MCO7226759.1 ATP-binding cassette domain-containing protein [Pleionea sp. CnH1-48]
MINVSGLTRYFDSFCAVDQLSFDIKEGDIVGFLGPNGAGKSTTMKMLTGFLAPSSGSVLIDNIDMLSDPVAAKKLIGYLPEGAPGYDEMMVVDFLRFIGQIRGFSGDALTQRVAEVIAEVQLQDVLYKRIDMLSKGFKRRVGIAQAIFHNPKILILDEPTDGLDPNQKHQVRQLIQGMSKDRIIIVSTHILEEVTAVCNRAMIIARGKKLFDGTPKELLEKSKQHNAIALTLDQAVDTSAFDALPEISEVMRTSDNEWLLIGDGPKALHKVVDELKKQSVQPLHLAIEQGQLDDVFRMMTEGK